jgi:anti-sigma B factor antagonist
MTNTLTFRAEGDVVIVDVYGALTIGSDSGALRAILHELADAGYRNFLVNMAGVTQIDTAGIGELMAAYTSLARVNGMLKLLKLEKLVECVFRATKLDSTFEWYEDENAAILSFHSANRKQCKETLCVSLPSDAYLG